MCVCVCVQRPTIDRKKKKKETTAEGVSKTNDVNCEIRPQHWDVYLGGEDGGGLTIFIRYTR